MGWVRGIKFSLANETVLEKLKPHASSKIRVALENKLTKAIPTAMNEQSQDSQAQKIFHTKLRRTALRMASRFNLSRIDLQVLQNLIEWISFKDGLSDPTQEISEPLSTYMEDLDIPHKARISEAFSALEKHGLITTRRVKNTAHRALSPYFIAETISHIGVTRSRNRQLAGYAIAEPRITRSRNPGLRDHVTPALDRKKDERKDERMDGRMDGRNPSPSKVGGKVSPMAKDYATMYQDLYHGSYRYLAVKDFARFNEYVQKILNKRGEPEMGELIVFAAKRLMRVDAMDRRKISLFEFQGHVADWDGSQEKQDWLQSLKRVDLGSQPPEANSIAAGAELGAL